MSGYCSHVTCPQYDYEIHLSLKEEKPPVLHQGAGLVNLGEAAESYYYSRPRPIVSGTISVCAREVPVTGSAWFDHQWGNFDPGL